MKKIEVLKGGIGMIVGTGVSILVGGALMKVTPANLGPIKRLAVKGAGLAISMMAVEKVTDYVEESVDGAVNDIQDIIVNAASTVKEEAL